jgi:hypothetical protein
MWLYSGITVVQPGAGRAGALALRGSSAQRVSHAPASTSDHARAAGSTSTVASARSRVRTLPAAKCST